MDTGELDPKHIQVLFIEWLCGDRPEGDTQVAFAERHGVHPKTLSKWKKDDQFCAQWEKRMRDTHASPDKQNTLLETLYEEALKSKDHKAIEAYFRLIDKMSPNRIEIKGHQELAEMSDEELAAAAEDAEFLRAV